MAALAVVLSDLSDIRSNVQDAWKQYLQGDTSLVSAAVTTNVAIYMVQGLEDMFVKDSSLSSAEEARQNFLVSSFLSVGQNPVELLRSKDPVNLRYYGLLELQFMNAFDIGSGLCRSIALGHPTPLWWSDHCMGRTSRICTPR
jgi:hypothetical protein